MKFLVDDIGDENLLRDINSFLISGYMEKDKYNKAFSFINSTINSSLKLSKIYLY